MPETQPTPASELTTLPVHPDFYGLLQYYEEELKRAEDCCEKVLVEDLRKFTKRILIVGDLLMQTECILKSCKYIFPYFKTYRSTHLYD